MDRREYFQKLRPSSYARMFPIGLGLGFLNLNLAQGCIGEAILAAYLWRVGQPKLLSTGPAPEHGGTADAQLAMLWMILARPTNGIRV